MDWDKDGELDILSGCYWTSDEDGAHLQILKGNGDMDFAKSESVMNVAGKPLQNVEVAGDDSKQTLAICTEQHAVDYDGDGDLDLVMGCFGSKFYLYENLAEGAEDANSISDQPICLSVSSTSYHAAPHLADWDNDGDLDLLSGTANGGAVISENTGTREKPEWSPFKHLIEASDRQEQMDDEEIEMAPSTRIWATDFNRDGWLDLLVGDSTTIVKPAEGLTREEWKFKRAEADKKMQELAAEQQKFMPEYQEAVKNGGEPPRELADKMQEFNDKYMEIYNGRKEYESSRRTGHVWLLIREPGDQRVDAAAPEDKSLSQN